MSIRPVIIGNFGPATLACIRSWGEKGCKVGFICIAPGNAPMPQSKHLDAVTILLPGQRFKPEGLHLITQFLQEFNATGLLAISEDIACWLYENRDAFPDSINLWVNTPDALRQLLPKRHQVAMAREAGFEVLSTHLISSAAEVEAIPAADYPLCLRPSDPGSIRPGFKVKYIENSTQLVNFIGAFKKYDKPIVAQPFLMLPNLNIHASRGADGQLHGLQSFLVRRKFKGVSLTFEPYAPQVDISDRCAALAEKLDARGPLDIECLYDEANAKIYFIELNNRLGGATAKAFACGYDEPFYALKSHGFDLGAPRALRRVVVASRHAIVKCALATLQRRLTPFDYPEESAPARLLFLGKAFFTHYDDIFSFADLKGSLSLYYTNIQNKIVGS